MRCEGSCLWRRLKDGRDGGTGTRGDARVQAEAEEEEAAVPGVEGHVPRQGVRGRPAQQEAHAAVESVRVRAGGRR